MKTLCWIPAVLMSVLGLVCPNPPILSAQGLPTPHRTAADTGRMTWGHQIYTRYTSAADCDRAVRDIAAEIWRTGVHDTVPYTLETDTLPTAAVSTARMCGAQFTAATVAPRDLWGLLRMSLDMNDSAQANAAVARQLALATTPGLQAYVLRTAIQNYLDAYPPKIQPVHVLMQRLDALGDGANLERYQAHVRLLRYWHVVYNPDSIRSEATTALNVLRYMAPEERDQVDVFRPYFALLGLAQDAHDLPAQKALIDSGLAQVGVWHDSKGAEIFAQVDRLLETQMALYGKPTQALRGNYWFNDGGTAHPVPGKVSLLVHVDHRCGAQCLALYALLRQIGQQYGANLDLTLITDTRGFAPGTGPLSPDEEAIQVSHYFLDFLKIPAALLVDRTPYSKRPDGHIVYQTSPIGDMFNGWQLIDAILVDKAGRVQWLGEIDSGEDRHLLQAEIAHALSPLK